MIRVWISVVLCVVLATATASAEPDSHWHSSLDETVTRLVADYSLRKKPTAFLVVRDGKIIASWGDVDRKVNVASVRKTLLSALYGVAVSEGRIDLDDTMADLDIDDKGRHLSKREKQATVADLLKARSGIYHRAAYETSRIRMLRPPRGSRKPGAYWFYNNWDFNALGTIYRERTGEDIFASFAERIAEPIGMEDFSQKDGSYLYERSSDHPAYLFKLTARDAARFGLLYANGGRWGGRQIIPEAWVEESTRSYSRTRRANRGYGYMWWVHSGKSWGEGGIYASGSGGQLIAVLPAKKLVIVQLVDMKLNRKGIRAETFFKVVEKIVAATSG